MGSKPCFQPEGLMKGNNTLFCFFAKRLLSFIWSVIILRGQLSLRWHLSSSQYRSKETAQSCSGTSSSYGMWELSWDITIVVLVGIGSFFCIVLVVTQNRGKIVPPPSQAIQSVTVITFFIQDPTSFLSRLLFCC
jgi:hypothetical protein